VKVGARVDEPVPHRGNGVFSSPGGGALVVFSAKYIRRRARGRGPLGLFAQPRHTFAQYDYDDGEGDADVRGSIPRGALPRPSADDRRKSG